MPSFLTHCLFAEDVLENIEDEELKKNIKDRMPLYYLGAQGPDIFFYYKAKPWIKYDGMEKLGYLMHDNKTSLFFNESLDYIKKIKISGKEPQDNKSRMRANDYFAVLTYITGYLCHFSLDFTTHPYIHYSAGIDTEKNRSTHKYHNYHKLLENIIDVHMLSYKKNIEAYMYKSYKLIEGSKLYQDSINGFYINILKKVYNIDISAKQVSVAVNDTQEILRLLYDPYGIKKFLFKIFEFIIFKNGEITTAMHPKKISKKIDYLNLNHKSFNHPCSEEIKLSKSFPELYDDALGEAKKYIGIASLYLHEKLSSCDFKKLFSDISYSTGLNCGTDKTLCYFNSIFES